MAEETKLSTHQEQINKLRAEVETDEAAVKTAKAAYESALTAYNVALVKINISRTTHNDYVTSLLTAVINSQTEQIKKLSVTPTVESPIEEVSESKSLRSSAKKVR